MVPVKFTGVKIPAAPTPVMTNFDWNDANKFITPKNIAVKSGTDGFTGVTYRFKACTATLPGSTSQCKDQQSTYYYTNTSNDIAVLDFGPSTLSKAGYSAATVMNSATPTTYDALRNLFIPVGYSVQGTQNLELKPRSSRKAWIRSALASSSGTARWAYSAPAFVNGAYDVGCWGDSGGPAFYQGKLVGVASTIGRSPLNNTSDCDPNLGTGESANITYVGLLLSDITSLQSAANTANASGSITLLNSGRAIDLWALPRQPSDIDQALSGSERALHFIASSSGTYTAAGTLSSGATAWTLLTTVKSQTVGGTIKQTTAANTGTRTATWNLTGLTPGYYRVEILYPRKSDNANCVLVQTKSTTDTIFVSRPARLNQQLGTGITTQTSVFSNTKTNVTPFNGTNPGSYIWVAKATTGTTGSLSVRLSDAGCPSGRIVADTVLLTFISNVK
jgi:hypothetical protein